MDTAQLFVSWDTHQKSICDGLSALQQRGEFVDMTIAADGHLVKVHQMVLSLVSPYIKALITSTQCPHPVIFLNKVSYQTLQSLLEYAYTGEVSVPKEDIGEFLEACRVLHFKGLESTLHCAANTVAKMYSKEKIPKKKPNVFGNELIQTEKLSISEDESTMLEDLDTKDPFESDHEKVVGETKPSIEERLPPQEKKDIQKASVDKPTKLPAIQYSVSNHGRVQLVLNRFIYSLRNTRKNQDRYWRCINQQISGCPAVVGTDGIGVTTRKGAHNHAFHDVQIVKRVQNSNMFEAWRHAESAAADTQRRKDQRKLWRADPLNKPQINLPTSQN